MPRLSKTLVLFILLLTCANAQAQKSIERIDSLAGRFIKHLRKEYSEKLMVQTNKNVFLAGRSLVKSMVN